MIVLHLAALEDRLLLWGEAPPVDTASTRRRDRSSSVPRSPYDPGHASLAEVAVLDGGGCGAPSTHVAWLPTRSGAPAPSGPLVAESPVGPGRFTLSPWSVTTLDVSLVQAVSLLGRSAGRDTLRPGVLVGRDLAFWSEVLRFAAALVARQHFLPGLARIRGEWITRWKPLLTGEEAARFTTLARAMPLVCRALSEDASVSPRTHAVDALAIAVGRFVDHLVRVGVAGRTSARSVFGFDSIHDEWLHSLRSARPRMTGASDEIARLEREIDDWRRPVEVAVASPFRLCIRLVEPPEEAASRARAPWRVEYLLQDRSDPSLLLPASAVWARGNAAFPRRARGADARRFLLAALGQAASVDPRVEASLAEPAPDGYTTDAAGAHEFLSRTAWMLEQTGVGILLPAWWTPHGARARLTARASVTSPKLKASAGLSLDRVVQFEWRAALGGEPLSLRELEALARLKQPLVRFRGQWVELSGDEIQTALNYWKKKGGRATVRDVIHMALGGDRLPGGLDVDGVTATGWIGELLARLQDGAPLEELPPPDGLRGALRPYQARGYSWLAFLTRSGFGACLADDMGLGKTIQALALVARDWEAGPQRPTLLVCPTSVATNWRREAARFTPGLPVMVHHGAGRSRGATFAKEAARHALVVSTYALLHRDLEALRGIGWRGVILDEAQNVKNAETKQARAARALEAEYRIALTGTPVENNVGDLWSIMEFLNPGWLGSQAEFRTRFFLPIQTERDSEAAARLKRLSGPFVLRRLKTDRSIIADLPDKNEMKVYCTLTREQASLYRAVVDEASGAIEESAGIQRRGVILATLSKLKQVCNHPAQFLKDNSALEGRSGKLARLTEMLEEALSEGDRALVFTQFAEMGEILKRHLQSAFGRETLFLHGGVPKARRDRMVDRFQSGDGPPIFVLSLKAGGTGLNLTAASHVFHFDRWWNPAVEDQATDRAFRIGQRRDVQVHKFVCAGTLEERIDEMIESKKDVAERVVGTGEAWLTELSTAQLKDLFALRREAVEE